MNPPPPHQTPESHAADTPEPVATDVRVFTLAAVAIGLISLVILAASIVWRQRSASPGGLRSDLNRQLVEFQLTERSGRTIRRADLAGQVLVVNFVFTGCSLPCLEISRQMAAVQKRFEDRPEVRLVSLSVDPRSDTPPVLAEFARRFGAHPDRWLYLTGEKAAVHDLIERSFLSRSDPGTSPAEDGSESMPDDFGHTEQIAVVDRSGRVRGYFNGLKPGAAQAIAAAVENLLRESAP